jgi:hypothetical protein
MTVITMAVLAVVQAVVMYAAFTKFTNMFLPSNIEAKMRQKQRMKRIMGS